MVPIKYRTDSLVPFDLGTRTDISHIVGTLLGLRTGLVNEILELPKEIVTESCTPTDHLFVTLICCCQGSCVA